MLSKTILSRALILAFMVLIGYSIARSLQVGSAIGLFLAVVSLGAAVYFLYLLAKAKADLEQEESR